MHGVLAGPLQVVSSEGLSALFIGLTPTVCRNCIWNSIYYGTMHVVRWPQGSCCLSLGAEAPGSRRMLGSVVAMAALAARRTAD